MSSIVIFNDNHTGSSRVDIEFINIRLVDTQTVEVPDGISKKLDKKSGDDVKKKTEPPTNAGPVKPKETDPSKSVWKAQLDKKKAAASK